MLFAYLAVIAALSGTPPPPAAPTSASAPATRTVVVETLLDSTDRPPPPPSAWIVPTPAKRVRVTNMEVFNETNYPFWANHNALEGEVPFRVAVDASGRALGCEVIERSNVADLDRGTCDLLMEQVRFAPALDARGRPIAGIYRQTIRWRLEDRAPYPVADESVRAIVTVDAQGRRQCRIEASPGAEVDPRMCRAFLTNPGVVATVAQVMMDRAGDRDGWALVYHQGTLVPGGPAGDGSQIGEGRGEHLLDRGGVRLTIDAAGKVTDSATLPTVPIAGPGGADTCPSNRLIPYEPGAAGRVLIRMGATYVRER
ncbi:MAG: energy transducer TonB [Pseudomonadota bacterium]